MFYGLLEQVLNESVVSPDKITNAMDKHSKLIVTYKPVTKGREHATGPRLIGIFAYGQTKASNDCVRVYEYAGDTASFVPNWKLLRLDQFLSWKDTGQVFNEPPDKKFNPNGDDTMSVVFKVTSFNGDEDLTKDNEKGPKTSEDLFLTDTEKVLKKRGEQIKNQFDNPIYISDFKAKKGLEDYKNGKDEYTVGPKTSDNTQNTENGENTPSYKDEVSKMFEPLRNKIKNAPKIDLNPKFKEAPEEAQPEEKTPSYKDEVNKRFDGLRNKIKNAPKIDLSQYEKEKELKNLRKKLGDTSKPIKMNEMKQLLGIK